MRAAIYGAGAMGTVLGAYIVKNGGAVDLVSRNAPHVEALKRQGAHITGTVDFVQKVPALLPQEMEGVYDVILLMTKQRYNGDICRFLLKYLAADGVVCTLQNGLPEPSVAEVVGKERCLGCAVSWGATFKGRGEASLTSDSRSLTFALGSLYGGNKKTAAVQSLLSRMGRVTVEENFAGARWAKLAVNSAFSPLSAVTGLTFGEVAAGRRTGRAALALLNEAFAVARASGVRLAKIQGHDIEKIYGCRGGFKRAAALALLPLAMKRHKRLVSGMYYDLKAGRACEIDFISGVVARAGEKCGISTPVTCRVLEIAHKIERGELALSPDTVALL